MSPSIWTRCAGDTSVAPLAARAVRCVEAQHVISTRKLVDSAEEQDLLERLIEGQKPPLPPEVPRGLHYLLATSFRYPPLRHGSRFGTRAERSVWYGAEGLRTAFAETAYYRLLFLEGTAAPLGRVEVELTTFQVAVRTARAVDLTAPPFDAMAAVISSPTAYAGSQELGRDMRGAGVEAFRYRSARDTERGTNLGVFTAAAFASRRPTGIATWHATVERSGVEFLRRDLFRRDVFRFPRADFEVGGILPAPAL